MIYYFFLNVEFAQLHSKLHNSKIVYNKMINRQIEFVEMSRKSTHNLNSLTLHFWFIYINANRLTRHGR